MKNESLNLSLQDAKVLEALFKSNGYTLITDTDESEEWTSKLEQDAKGKIKQTNNNCTLVMENDSLLAGAIKKNELSGGIDIVKDLGWNRNGKSLTDTDIDNIIIYLERNYDLHVDRMIERAIRVVANQNSYNPIKDMLNGLKWDGKPRLENALSHFLGVEKTPINIEALKLFMFGAIERVFNPGCKFEYMLCLVGGQGAGKSTFLRFLAMYDNWFCDDIKQLSDKEVFEKLQGHWIIEMPEMTAILHAKYVEDTKAFLSRLSDTYRAPYDKYAQDHPRICVFAGSSNTIQFLPPDKSGNRRFIPIEVHMEKAETHILENENESRYYFAQMWAEAMEIYRSGNYKLAFTKELQKELVRLQSKYTPEDPMETAILNFIEENQPEYVCAKMLYVEALGNSPYSSTASWESKAIGEIMNQKCPDYRNIASHVFKDYGKQRAWVNTKKPDFKPITDDEEKELPFK